MKISKHFNYFYENYLENFKVDVRRLSATDFSKIWDELQRIGYNGPYNLGKDVFTCIYVYAAEEPALSFWWMWFYDSICVYVKTEPANYDVATLPPTTT